MHKMNRAWIELDINNLRHNVALLRTILPPGCELMPAVKANGYGHGAVLIAKELNKLGVYTFCVAALQEGIELREGGIEGDILILGYTPPESFDRLCQFDLTQTVVNCEYAQRLNDYGERIKVHIKIDTGMHRLGETWEHTDQILRIFRHKNLIIDGMFTHLCVADEPEGLEYTNLQIKRFYELTNKLVLQGISLPKLHIQNSYGVLNCKDLCCDYARVGIAMYGILSSAGDRNTLPLPLRPVLSLKARVELINSVDRGESIGYGLQFAAKERMKIAAITIGYADGVPRGLSCGRGEVLLNGKRAPIVGRICMDQLMVDVTHIPDVSQGDIAVIIGIWGECEITAYDIAEQTDTITNEVLSRLGGRLERIVL